MLKGFHTWIQKAISKIQIFKHFSDFIFELQNLLILKIMLTDRHSTEIAIFCPTFEMPKTVCECFKSRKLKT